MSQEAASFILGLWWPAFIPITMAETSCVFSTIPLTIYSLAHIPEASSCTPYLETIRISDVRQLLKEMATYGLVKKENNSAITEE